MPRTKLGIVSILVLILLAIMPAVAQQSKGAASLLNRGKYIPDIGTFLQIGANSPAGYSWDGKDVYFTSSMSGAPQIYRLTKDGWPYQLTTFEDGIDFFNLSYDGTMSIIGASIGGSEQSQLYLMDTKTGRIMPLTSGNEVQYGSATWSPDDSYIYYRSNEENKQDFFIYRMEIAGGKQEKIFGDTAGVRGYNSIADISADGGLIIISRLNSNADNDLFLFNLTTMKYTPLTKDDKDILYGSPELMPDNRTIWLTCNDNEEGIARLAKMDISSAKIEYVNDGWIEPRWEIDGLSFSRDAKYMAAFINEDGFVRMKLREVETKNQLLSPPLDGMLGGGYFDENGSCLLSFSGPTRTTEVWRWDPISKNLKQLTFAIYAGIDREIFTEPKLIQYKSFDGLEIPAFLYLPPNYKLGEPIPFVVDAHGGPESQFQPNFIRNFQYLLLNGYGVLAPNPRGSSGYGSNFMSLDNYKKRKDSLKDYKAAVEYLIANGYTKQGMIAIRGGSYGGYVVMGMITEYPDLFSAAINGVGIVNFKSFLENTAAYRRALREAEYGPLSDLEFLASISPIYKANMIKTPLLVVHGENDPRVPVGEARQIIEAIKSNGGVVDSLIFSDEGHGASKRVNIIAEYRKQVEFLDKHLKGKSN